MLLVVALLLACEGAPPDFPANFDLVPDSGSSSPTDPFDGGTRGGPYGPDTMTAGGNDRHAAPAHASGGLFQQPMPWTKDVSGSVKDGRSDAIIAALASMGGWGGGNKLRIDFSIPLFFTDRSTPRQVVSADPRGYCYGGPDCAQVPLIVPLPANGNTEGSSGYTCDVAEDDCHILAVETNEKKLYELYNATKAGGGFTALGAIVWDLARSYPENLRGDQCTSADAAGLPIAALLPTADEVAAGEVKHALRFILPNNRIKAKVYVRPATHAGGPRSNNPNAPPYGVRFRLKASFDEKSFNAGEKVILKALKKYGMILADGGNIALTFADDRLSPVKWATVGVTPLSLQTIAVDDFEVVDLTPEIARAGDCVRNP